MPEDVIDDTEIVYRRVPNDPMFFRIEEGRLRLTSAAFNDKAKRPSVDRSSLLNKDPQRAKTATTQGVVGLVVGEVRRVDKVTRTDVNGNVVETHQLDVIPDPLPDNPAHALVTHSPEFKSNRPFDRLKESLARLAEERGWLVEPT
ncbi:hypothetical protein [Cupriavidus sp. AcVe19-1a]|uniref:hypothetical protein n=1 Tax=Cupriavidus sp. AcVe19-1a TaxID=2821359 RepID=UPI001AE3BA39|nr:hypothetical protein [Cupriavidus sp. AcVe19-1a]MBP0631978.1 hypothetical protein [Cupriavidus sp. AcVe19-1a]